MPHFGKLDFAAWSKNAPAIKDYKTEPWTLKDARILNVFMEIDEDSADALLPAAMHPSIPAYVIFNVTRYPQSPVGAFTIAEARIAGRTAIRPRSFVLRSYCGNPDACRELTVRWGYPAKAGDVKMEVRHDRVIGRVSAGGRPILEIEMLDRDAISGADIQYIASMHLARNENDGKVVLVQVDPEYTFAKAERGRPMVVRFDPEAWGAGAAMRLTNPISASYAVADVTIPKIRYVCNPELPALAGTTKVAA
ncbi:MAG TPA: acetoacetate decarboxylase family protein [Candidatus Binataceae bacterium]|nr:acetoacetate decarboxylase family protein [Candidatus Binataceae bacterium]